MLMKLLMVLLLIGVASSGHAQYTSDPCDPTTPNYALYQPYCDNPLYGDYFAQFTELREREAASEAVATVAPPTSPPPQTSPVAPPSPSPTVTRGHIMLQDALAYAQTRTDVTNAQLELSDAQSSQQRIANDPLALRPDTVQAQQRVELAQADYQQKLYAAEAEITSAYTQALAADAQYAVAIEGLALSEQSLRIAQIRFDRGGATQLDVKDARTQVSESNTSVSAASEGKRLAYKNLSSLLGRPELELSPLDARFVPDMPDEDMVLRSLPQSPTMLRVRQGVELAQVGVDLLDPSYASLSEIDGAKLQLATAQEQLSETQRALDIQAKSRWNTANNAAENLAVQQEGLTNTQERLTLERQRLDSGLIPEIQYKQTALSTSQAESGFHQAYYDYLNALLQLQADTMYDVGAIAP